MRVIFLNAWHGNLGQQLRTYLADEAAKTQVFCFQECDGEMGTICCDTLKDFTSFTAHKKLNDREDFMQAVYVHKKIWLENQKILFAKDTELGLGLSFEAAYQGSRFGICNIHGISRPVDKKDTAVRIQQSTKLIKHITKMPGIKILGGDFNTLPDEKSITMFETAGYKSLIKDFAVNTTRNRYVWERYPKNKMYFSDYVFVERGTKLKSFDVPGIEVSDHLPMVVEL